PYQPTIVTILAVPTTDDSPAVPERTAVETILTMSPENKAYYESEKEVIHLLLTRIRDEIYLIVDACKTAHEMWIAIERLQQGESLNIQDVKTNLFWEFGKFTSHDGESMKSYYSRFYKMMNEMIRNNLTVALMQVNVQFLQQLQPEWSRIAENANPLALIAIALSYSDPYYQAPKSHKPYAPTSKQTSFTRSNASTKFESKEIAKPITPPFKSAFEKDKQADRLEDTDEEIDEQELEGHYSFMAKIQEVLPPESNLAAEPLEHLQNDAEYNVFANVSQHFEQPESTSNTCLVEKDDSNVTPDSPNMCDNDIQTDQNAEDERDVLANLIANLKLDVDENKKIQKQLKKAKASLTHELK
nr:hypothetical protein [Tanacetum cinerariifolium]GFA03350.1 hypothetical protein [Tanacetum cinerariifolium]